MSLQNKNIFVSFISTLYYFLGNNPADECTLFVETCVKSEILHNRMILRTEMLSSQKLFHISS